MLNGFVESIDARLGDECLNDGKDYFTIYGFVKE